MHNRIKSFAKFNISSVNIMTSWRRQQSLSMDDGYNAFECCTYRPWIKEASYRNMEPGAP